MSLDAKIRTALHTHLAAWPTGAKAVVTYQVGPFLLADMPIVDVEIGGWTKHLTGMGNTRGQRPYNRVYDLMIHVVNNTSAADFAESVNLIADQIERALSQFDQIAGVNFQDLTIRAGEYHPVNSEEGLGGSLTLVGSVEVLVNEARPDVSVGLVPEQTIFPFPAT